LDIGDVSMQLTRSNKTIAIRLNKPLLFRSSTTEIPVHLYKISA